MKLAYRRMFERVVYKSDIAESTERFLWDGYNPVARVDGSGKLLQSCLWGLDLSGTPQGAGGVGGLLAVTDLSVDTDETYFPFYDGNGNVTGYADASDGSLSCSFDYGPFGEPVKAVGEAADKLDYRFSTKFTDDVTGIVHYELRPLDTQTGRWPTRDPIEEQGGINLYGFVDNDAVNQWDYLGLSYVGDLVTLLTDPSVFWEQKAKDYLKKNFILNIYINASELGVSIGNSINSGLVFTNLIADLDLKLFDLTKIDDCLGDFGLNLNSNVGTRMLDYCLCVGGYTNKNGYATAHAISMVPKNIRTGVKNFSKNKIIDFTFNKINSSLGLGSNNPPKNLNELAEDFAEFLSDTARDEVKQLNY